MTAKRMTDGHVFQSYGFVMRSRLPSLSWMIVRPQAKGYCPLRFLLFTQFDQQIECHASQPRFRVGYWFSFETLRKIWKYDYKAIVWSGFLPLLFPSHPSPLPLSALCVSLTPRSFLRDSQVSGGAGKALGWRRKSLPEKKPALLSAPLKTPSSNGDRQVGGSWARFNGNRKSSRKR